LLDDEAITPADRLRLVALYILYRDGLVPADTQRLLAHANLPVQDGEVLNNLDLLGARIQKPLKDAKTAPQPLFPKKAAPPAGANEEYILSRFEPAVKLMLEDNAGGLH
jgi:syntaxin-binding protein 1